MVHAVAVKCPNCNAGISPETSRCEYCGAYILVQNDISTLRDRCNCTGCGESIGVGSLVCANCGIILAQSQNDIESLREIKKRLVFLQQKVKVQFSNMAKQRIGEDEYILFYEHAGFTENIVTNIRFFSYAPPGPNPELLKDVPFEQIVEIGPITALPDWVNELSLRRIGKILYEAKLMTFDGPVTTMVSNTADFHKALNSALMDHIHKRKNINAILCSLKL